MGGANIEQRRANAIGRFLGNPLPVVLARMFYSFGSSNGRKPGIQVDLGRKNKTVAGT